MDSSTPGPVAACQTEVSLTGTGMPGPHADRAGPGVLVQRGDVRLQFDAGRATTMRLAALGVRCAQLSAVFVTHHHSDHLLGLADVVLSRWLETSDPLQIVVPQGPAVEVAATVLDPWHADIALRQEIGRRAPCPAPVVSTFDGDRVPTTVWTSDDVVVSSVLVNHPPVVPAVAYRVDTPEGSVVISGDTAACEEVEQLARGATVLVHEVVRHELRTGTELQQSVAGYHTDAVELGALARHAGVEWLLLTHLIPPPDTFQDVEKFTEQVRQGGYEGPVVVGEDLASVALNRNFPRGRQTR